MDGEAASSAARSDRSAQRSVRFQYVAIRRTPTDKLGLSLEVRGEWQNPLLLVKEIRVGGLVWETNACLIHHDPRMVWRTLQVGDHVLFANGRRDRAGVFNALDRARSLHLCVIRNNVDQVTLLDRWYDENVARGGATRPEQMSGAELEDREVEDMRQELINIAEMHADASSSAFQQP